MNRTLNPDLAARPSPARVAARRRRGRRGFTLIEIIVSLSAGLLVSVAAFSMSKNATAFFQHETRISSAQLALTLGMNRLTADLQRASFLASPNAKSDPMVCRDISWTAGLNSFAGITIRRTTPLGTSQAGVNGLAPDQVIVGGSMDSSESFTVQCLLPGSGGGPALQLQTAVYDNAMARVQASLGGGETLAGKLGLIFASGRFVNILDPATGYSVYGVISGVSVSGTVATVQLAPTVTLPKKPASPCGIISPAAGPQCGGGLMVSAVSRYLYDVRSLAGNTTGNYGLLVAPISAATSGDGGRTELVRVELDSAGAEIPSTLQLISEYTVDMRFGITVSTKITNDNYNPTVTTYAINDDNVYSNAGDVSAAGPTPQLIRSVQVRLATRTRAPDRNTDLPTGADGRRLHYAIPSVQPGFARVRTAYANVALPNQGGFSLW